MYCDLETTGLNPKADSIVQLAGIICSDLGEEEFNWKIRPYRPYELSHGAKIKTGFTPELLESFEDQAVIFTEFNELLKRHQGEKKEKIHFVGYNSTSFDMAFMRDWFEFNRSFMFGRIFYFPSIDVMHLAAFYLMGRRGNLVNFQLETVYETLMGHRMENAHDALADIKATREMLSFLTRRFMAGLKFMAELNNPEPEIPQTKPRYRVLADN